MICNLRHTIRETASTGRRLTTLTDGIKDSRCVAVVYAQLEDVGSGGHPPWWRQGVIPGDLGAWQPREEPNRVPTFSRGDLNRSGAQSGICVSPGQAPAAALPGEFGNSPRCSASDSVRERSMHAIGSDRGEPSR